ncbi:MAG: hypothetical protein Q9226_008526, partial [Calogaya cf. arnoldii]
MAYFSGTDYRTSIPTNALDAAADAPEVDHAVQAPEYGPDRGAPEVSTTRGIQVFYDSSPPEAIGHNHSTCAHEGSSGDKTPLSQKSRERRVMMALMAFILVAIALGVGLGVGLTKRKQATDPPANSDSLTGSNILRLDCVMWLLNRENPDQEVQHCWTTEELSIDVAPNSHQISVHWFKSVRGQDCLFLQYQGLSRQIVTKFGIHSPWTESWHWLDYTDKLNKIIEQAYQAL